METQKIRSSAEIKRTLAVFGALSTTIPCHIRYRALDRTRADVPIQKRPLGPSRTPLSWYRTTRHPIPSSSTQHLTQTLVRQSILPLIIRPLKHNYIDDHKHRTQGGQPPRLLIYIGILLIMQSVMLRMLQAPSSRTESQTHVYHR